MGYDPRDIEMLPPGPMPYTLKRKSEREARTKLDAMLQRLSDGDLGPVSKNHREPVRDIYCPLCHYRKRSRALVPSNLAGRRIKGSPLPGKFIECCADCAKEMNAARAG